MPLIIKVASIPKESVFKFILLIMMNILKEKQHLTDEDGKLFD